MERRIQVLIADDRPPSRNGLRALLASSPRVGTVYEAANGLEALQLAERTQPNVVLMDICMPVMDGLEATRLLKCRWPHIRVVALSINARYRKEALTAGADDFLVKGCPTEDLLKAVSRNGEHRQSLEEETKPVLFRPICASLAS
jgi:DNA-binding NarL/FixJ family response regulator